MDPESNVTKVGYCQPPVEHRFEKGTSGNPAGRPKKKPGLDEAFRRELDATITLMMDGKRQMLTKAEVIAKQVTNAAMKGDFKFLKLVLAEMRREKQEGSAAGNCVPPQPQMTLEEANRVLLELLGPWSEGTESREDEKLLIDGPGHRSNEEPERV